MVHIEAGFEETEIAEMTERVESLAAEQQAGFGFALQELSPLEQELLIVWHATARTLERQQQTQIETMLAALFV